jgi:hypothetical protein
VRIKSKDPSRRLNQRRLESLGFRGDLPIDVVIAMLLLEEHSFGRQDGA